MSTRVPSDEVRVLHRSGHGPSYPAREGSGTSARRRQLRRLLLFVCTPGAVLGVATLVTALSLGAFDHAPRSAPVSCRPAVAVDPTTFKIAVLNGSGIQGQAADAARQLKRAGFRVATVATAPDRRWTDAPAVITYGSEGRDAAALLATRIPGAVSLSTVRPGRDVDLVLGTRFTEISMKAAPSPAQPCGSGGPR